MFRELVDSEHAFLSCASANKVKSVLFMLELVTTPSTIGEAATLWFALVICHALADYPLQGDFLAKHKCRNYQAAPGEPPVPPMLWLHCLFAHSLIHAGFVWLITGSVIFGLAEFVLHCVIDFLKGEGITDFQVDQALHLFCKLGYVAIAYFMATQAFA